MSAQSPRQYDLVIFGATGFTGALAASQVPLNTPSTLTWAIAGRTTSKLTTLATTLNARHPDRTPVEIITADLSPDDLDRLAKSTRCLISTVGPFTRHGTPVVEACARNGTHYVDSTGEATWVKSMIDKYHETAKRTGAIMVPQCGFESAPADFAAYALVRYARENFGRGLEEVVLAVHDLKTGVSGGTLESIVTIFETTSIRELLAWNNPYYLSPLQGTPYKIPLIRRHPQLGILTSWLQALPDMNIVMRSWGLDSEYYGKAFTFAEYKVTSSMVAAVGWACAVAMLAALVVPPLRWVMRWFAVPVGSGPAGGGWCEWKGVGVVEVEAGGGVGEGGKRLGVRVRAEVDAYVLTAVLMVCTAVTMLEEGGKGGIVTPSVVARGGLFKTLEKAGVVVEVEVVE